MPEVEAVWQVSAEGKPDAPALLARGLDVRGIGRASLGRGPVADLRRPGARLDAGDARRLLRPRSRREDDPAGLAAGLEAARWPAVPCRQPRPVRLPAESRGRRRIAGRLHRLRAGRSPDRRNDMLGLPHAADHGRRQDVPDRRRPGHRRLPELPHRSRRRGPTGPDQRRGVPTLRRRGARLRHAGSRGRLGAPPESGRLVPALPHADDARLAEGCPLGAGPARRRRHDPRPPHRPRPRSSAGPPHPR